MEADINFIRILRSLEKSFYIFPEQISKTARINIKPSFIKFFAFNKVFNPGASVISRYSSLNHSILLAGGAKFIKGPVKFISNDYNGTIEMRKFTCSKRNKLGAYKKPLLKSGDKIRLKINIVNFANELLDEFTRNLIGDYAAKEVFANFWNYL